MARILVVATSSRPLTEYCFDKQELYKSGPTADWVTENNARKSLGRQRGGWTSLFDGRGSGENKRIRWGGTDSDWLNQQKMIKDVFWLAVDLHSVRDWKSSPSSVLLCCLYHSKTWDRPPLAGQFHVGEEMCLDVQFSSSSSYFGLTLAVIDGHTVIQNLIDWWPFYISIFLSNYLSFLLFKHPRTHTFTWLMIEEKLFPLNTI